MQEALFRFVRTFVLSRTSSKPRLNEDFGERAFRRRELFFSGELCCTFSSFFLLSSLEASDLVDRRVAT